MEEVLSSRNSETKELKVSERQNTQKGRVQARMDKRTALFCCNIFLFA